MILLHAKKGETSMEINCLHYKMENWYTTNIGVVTSLNKQLNLLQICLQNK